MNETNYWIHFLVLILFVTLLYIWYQRKREELLRLENENLRLQKNILEEYHRSLKKQVFLSGKIRQDIANHLQTMERLMENLEFAQTREMQSHADSLNQEYNRLCSNNYCDNFIIDAAISNKVTRCEGYGIAAEIDTRGLRLGEMKESDMLGILYNIFDNAIEGCLKVSEADKRFLSFCCDEVSNRLVMTMRNSADEVISDGKKLKTTKQNKEVHGVGMSIIGDIVRKYGGNLAYSIKDHVFEIEISLPAE